MGNSRPPRQIYREPKPKEKWYERIRRERQDYDPRHEPIIGEDYSGFPSSIFITIRLVLFLCLILGIPFVLFAFSESIIGYLKVVAIFSINEIICRYFGWDKMNVD